MERLKDKRQINYVRADAVVDTAIKLFGPMHDDDATTMWNELVDMFELESSELESANAANSDFNTSYTARRPTTAADIACFDYLRHSRFLVNGS